VNPFRAMMLRAAGGGGGPTDPYWANVVSLLHFDGPNNSTTFTDQKTRTWTPSGNAKIDTSQSLFGGSSARFDGNGDWITASDPSAWTIGANQDFTLEFALRLATNVGPRTPFEIVSSLSYMYGEQDYNTSSRRFRFVMPSSSTIETTSALSASTWYRLALSRTGTTVRLFLNGTQEGSITDAAGHSGAATAALIGCAVNSYGSTYGINGWIDEFRFTKGVGRYTSNYTPAAAPFPNS